MATYLNFYETITEANMRLRGTFVLYDGEPYYVLCITNHKPDGVFRIYLEPIGEGEDKMSMHNPYGPPINNYTTDDPALGEAMDKWLDKYIETTKVIRKMANSPLFRKFRPFPLGMCNYDGQVFYLERQPNRKTEQGLTFGMVGSSPVSLNSLLRDGRRPERSRGVDFYSPSFRDCIKGEHPSAQDCIDNLKDPEVINESAAFHRHFAFVRGPLDMIFLANKDNIVGVMPHGTLECVRVGRDFRHTKEVIEALGIFGCVTQD